MAKKYFPKRYAHICTPFLDEFKKDIEDGYSPSYAARNLSGGVEKLRRNQKHYPEIAMILENYRNRDLSYKH